MANLASLTHTGKLNRKKGTGTRPAGSVIDTDMLQNDTGGTTTYATNHHNMQMCYHRVLNKIFATFMNADNLDTYGVVLTPSADGETVTWGTPVVIHVDIASNSSCSYDRKEQKILWAGQSWNLSGRRTASRVVSISGTTPSYGTTVALGPNEGSVSSDDWAEMGDNAMVYLGDDAGASAGYHLLLKSQYITDADDKLYAYIGQITAGSTNVTWTSGTEIETRSNISQPSLCKIADNKAFGMWMREPAQKGECGVFVVTPGSPATVAVTKHSSPAFTLNTVAFHRVGTLSCCYDMNAQRVIMAYWTQNGSNHELRIRAATISGTTTTLHSEVSVVPEAVQDHGKVTVCYDENAQKSTVYYKRTVGGTVKFYAKSVTVSGNNITLGAEKLIEAPAGSKTFEKGPNTHFSYSTCSTYVSNENIKKTFAIRAGGDMNNQQGGLPKATPTHFNKSTLTVDLSQGNSFELDIDTHTGIDGDIGIFNITESLGGGKTQMFFLKIVQGSSPINFNWDKITNVKWPGGTGPSLTETNNAVDVLSFITWDEGTTWYGTTEGLNIN